MGNKSQNSNSKIFKRDIDERSLSPNHFLVYKQWVTDPDNKLLIEGYARREFDVNLKRFDVNTTAIICLYYTKRYTKDEIYSDERNHKLQKTRKANFDKLYGPKIRSKKAAKRHLRSEGCRYAMIIALILIMFILGLITIFAAKKQSKSNLVCGPSWLYAAGYALLFHASLYLIELFFEFTHVCCAFCGRRNSAKWLKKFRNGLEDGKVLINVFSWIMLLWIGFYLVWASFGLFIYNHAMSAECKQDFIGQMIIAWCILAIFFSISACRSFGRQCGTFCLISKRQKFR